MTIRPELLDELLKDYQTPQDLFGENGSIKQLTKGMIERCLQAEMQEHLGYPRHGREARRRAPTRAMAQARRRSRASTASWRSACRETGMAVLNRCW
jgi:transposase-like protein